MRNEYIYELDRKITFTFCSLSCKLLNANAECFIPASEICNNNVNALATVNSNDTLKNFRTACIVVSGLIERFKPYCIA